MPIRTLSIAAAGAATAATIIVFACRGVDRAPASAATSAPLDPGLTTSHAAVLERETAGDAFAEARQAALLREEARATLAEWTERQDADEAEPEAPPVPAGCRSIDQGALQRTFESMTNALSAVQDALWAERSRPPEAGTAHAAYASYRAELLRIAKLLPEDAHFEALVAELPSPAGTPLVQPRHPLLGEIFGPGFDGAPETGGSVQLESGSSLALPDPVTHAGDLSAAHTTALAMLDVMRWFFAIAGEITDRVAKTCGGATGHGL